MKQPPTAPRLRVAQLRPPGAAHRLHALVMDRHDQPFAWGFRDCCLWAADAALAATGHDPMADLRGSYFSARQAARLAQAHGGLQAMATARLGSPIAQADALDGDVCLLAPHAAEYLPGLGALAVLWRGSILAQADRGLAVRRLSDATCWWGVQP